MKYLFIIILSVFSFSCAHVDVDTNVKKQNSTGVSLKSNKKEKENKISEIENEAPSPEVIVVEQPIFIPAKEAPPTSPKPGLDTAKESNKVGIIMPSDYSHAAVVYDYNPDWVYEVYAMPLRVCDIRLEPNEKALEIPFVSDSERWNIGAGVSQEGNALVQHIYVKPAAKGQEASLIINTDRRVYHIVLRSFSSAYMPIVRWRYHSGLPENYISSAKQDSSPQNMSEGSTSDGPFFTSVDPRFLSFNYRITYGFFSKPLWLPELVFDDGSKTYITFPKQILQKELPAVFENRKDKLNYRVMGNLIIIDKLIENITVKIGRKEITIAKKRG